MEPNQPYQLSDFTAPAPKGRGLKIVLIVTGIVVLLCLGGGVIAAVSANNNTNKAATLPLVATTPDPTPAETTAAAEPEATDPTTRLTTPPAAKPDPEPVTISGNDIVHVGYDVPAGTYRVTTRVDPDEGCYWLKSTDAEGEDIIDNANVAGGRPQVTLKKGQWFTSEDCPDWTKQRNRKG